MSDTRPTAFVAMQFNGDHWRDKRYMIIREVLEEGGYKCVRADEIRTSGPVVEEVCRLLKTADLVVIDNSGSSHSVSYEIGYCHGVGRAQDTTILLSDNADLPFNYRHYRHRVYRDLRHLRRLLRDFLKISTPLTDDQIGYTFSFEFSKECSFGYILDGAECIFNALSHKHFTGRCDCYSAEHFGMADRYFSVAIAAHTPGRKKTPSYSFWRSLFHLVEIETKKFNGNITLVDVMSELSEVRAIKDSLIFCGGAEFESGQIVQYLGTEDEGNFFRRYTDRKDEEAQQDAAANP